MEEFAQETSKGWAGGGRFCPWLQKQITKMGVVTQLFSLLPCKVLCRNILAAGTKLVFFRTDATSEFLITT